jgi:hypothetical protein
MFGFIVGAITGGLVMWYRNRIMEFAADHMIGEWNPRRSSSPAIDG